MKSLLNYNLIVNDVFYRGYHILDYIEENPDMSDLDKEAIKATIMDALVYKQLIDPNKETLDFNNLSIVESKDSKYYQYEEHPFIMGIPLCIKEEFRKHALSICGGVPISMFLTIPTVSRCVYDMNTAVSAIFDDFTMYTVNYNSPTRPGKIATDRPFIEVTINKEKYLVDNLTRRIFRSDKFKELYGFDVINSYSKKDLKGKRKKYYQKAIKSSTNMAMYLMTYFCMEDVFSRNKRFDEHAYEMEKSKEYFPDGWRQYEEQKQMLSGDNFKHVKTNR